MRSPSVGSVDRSLAKMGLLPAVLLVAWIAMTLQVADVQAAAPYVGLFAPDRYEGIPEMCLMPMDFGYCRAKVKRYYFDMRRMKCAMFYWGGCAGNINNFKSLEDCNKNCLDAYETSSDSDSRNAVAPSYKAYAGRSGTRGTNAEAAAAKNDTIGSPSTAYTGSSSYKSSNNKNSERVNNNNNNNNNYNIQNRNSQEVGDYDDEEA